MTRRRPRPGEPRWVPTYVRPVLVSRLAAAGFCGYVGVLAWREPWPLPWRLLIVAALTTLAVRALRTAVVIEPKRVVVRGHFWSRRIPRDAIEDVTGFPSLVWRKAGRRRKTPVVSLMTSHESWPWINRAHEASAEQLRRILARKKKKRR